MGTSVNRDELFEALEDIGHEVNHGAAYVALKAIIELHKPDEYSGNTCQAHEMCWGCGEWGESDGCDCNEYPCQTIKAIEGVFDGL